MSDALAVVVGIDRYPDALLGPLAGAINDAEAFCAWLKTPDGGGLTETTTADTTEIHKVLSIDDGSGAIDARPTTAEVERALEHVRESAEARLAASAENGAPPPYRRLYLYFAGHGIGPDVEQAALLMANAGQGRFGHYVQGRRYANYFRARASFDEVILFMDCCRDRYPYVAAPALRWDPDPPEPARDVEPAFLFAFATKWSKKSREGVVGGQPRGFFSAALLEGLKGSAANAAGNVTAQTLDSYVNARLPRIVNGGKVEDPDFMYKPLDPLVLIKYGAAASRHFTKVRVTLSVAHQAPSAVSVVQDNQPVALADEVRVRPDLWTFRLPFGVYSLQNVATRQSAPFQVLGPEDVDVTF